MKNNKQLINFDCKLTENTSLGLEGVRLKLVKLKQKQGVTVGGGGVKGPSSVPNREPKEPRRKVLSLRRTLGGCQAARIRHDLPHIQSRVLLG